MYSYNESCSKILVCVIKSAYVKRRYKNVAKVLRRVQACGRWVLFKCRTYKYSGKRECILWPVWDYQHVRHVYVYDWIRDRASKLCCGPKELCWAPMLFWWQVGSQGHLVFFFSSVAIVSCKCMQYNMVHRLAWYLS